MPIAVIMVHLKQGTNVSEVNGMTGALEHVVLAQTVPKNADILVLAEYNDTAEFGHLLDMINKLETDQGKVTVWTQTLLVNKPDNNGHPTEPLT